ncbi:N-acetylmuramoyl-L-alanine amidase [Corynebacterium callunae]|uniref:N-acetylmuramoyl-L-alanine amidase n=1 Tax=Corynebacterium callunae TaxID=1721 RepID=UPI0039820CF1
MQQRRRISEIRHKPILAILLSTALVASGLTAAGTQYLNTQSEGIGPVAVQNESESFSAGSNVLVEDSAITAQGEGSGPRTVKEFQRDEPFSMFALTWTGQKDVTSFVRAEQADGSWSQWYAMEPLATQSSDPAAKNGTDLIWHGPTTKIQVATHNVELFDDQTAVTGADEAGVAVPEAAPAEAPVEAPAAEAAPAEPAPAEAAPAAEYSADTQAETQAETPAATDGLAPLPSNYGEIQPVADVDAGLDAVFIDGNEEAGVGIDNVADTDGMPKVISRAGWGADESLRCSNPTIDDGVSAITIHHTAGSNDYTPAQSAAQVRGYYNYHAKTLGWCDIGYQSLVDKYGTIYEGRYGGMTRAVQGAHAGGFNQNTWAISMMGDYSTVQPSSATIQSVGELAGWRAKVAGFDPTGTDTHYSEGTSYSKYAYGAAVTLPNIFAHRDVGTTSCPGDAGYAQMSTIRSIAKAKYNSLVSGVPSSTSATSTESTSTPATTAPAANEPAPAPAPVETPATDDQLAELLAGSSADSETTSLLTGLGSIAAVILAAILGSNDISTLANNIGDNNGVPVLYGMKISEIIPVVDTIMDLTGDNKYSRAWNDLNSTLGPVLGAVTGGETTVNYTSDQNSEVSFVPFENGLMVSSPEAGTHALWGAIGDAWAAQGADLGPLGLPTSNEYTVGNQLRVDFQNGYIIFDKTTGNTEIHTN